MFKTDALEQLGYTLKANEAFVTPGFECIWPDHKRSVGPSLKDLIDTTRRSLSGQQCVAAGGGRVLRTRGAAERKR